MMGEGDNLEQLRQSPIKSSSDMKKSKPLKGMEAKKRFNMYYPHLLFQTLMIIFGIAKNCKMLYANS
jgi:hypothetical protein